MAPYPPSPTQTPSPTPEPYDASSGDIVSDGELLDLRASDMEMLSSEPPMMENDFLTAREGWLYATGDYGEITYLVFRHFRRKTANV